MINTVLAEDVVLHTWDSIFRVNGVAGGKGDSGRVVLLVLLPAAVEQQQSQEQDHQQDEHHDASDGPPRFLLTWGERNHDAAHPF